MMKTMLFLAVGCLMGTFALYDVALGPPVPRPSGEPVRHRLISDIFDSIRYDEAGRTLTVVFKNGYAYEYLNVPPSCFEDFLLAERKAEYFNSCIRRHFPFRRIDEPGKRRAD